MRKNAFLIIILVILGILTRTIWHILPNFEFVTSISVISGYFLKNKLKFIPTIFILIISDTLIGNSSIFIFTWSAFILAPLFGILSSTISKKFSYSILLTTFCSFIFVIFFYLYTNLGVVLESNLYTKDLAGLISSYINALPFLYNQICSSLITTPIIFILITILIKILSNFKYWYVTKYYRYTN